MLRYEHQPLGVDDFARPRWSSAIGYGFAIWIVYNLCLLRDCGRQAAKFIGNILRGAKSLDNPNQRQQHGILFHSHLRLALTCIFFTVLGQSAFAAPQGEYKAFTFTSPLGCLGLTTEYGGVPDCYDFNQYDARWEWSPNLKFYVPASLPRLRVAQLPTCSASFPDVQYGFAVITDSSNLCTAGNTLAGGGTGNTCLVACVQSSSAWAWSIVGSIGGGGGGGGVTAVGANAPITLTGTASNPIVNLTTPLAAQYGGTGVVSPTAHTLGIAEGSSAFTFLTGTLNLPLIGQGAGADPVFTALNLGGAGVTGTLPVGNGGTGCPSPVAVAGLPAGVEGDICTVTDSTKTCIDGSTVTGGGSNVCAVFYNGTAWQMIGTVAGAATGTVTSVALAPPTGISVSGSPITSSGTFTLTWGTATVSGLPTCNSGAKGAYNTVTDSTNSCQAGNALSGSGSIVCGVYCNGSAWNIVGTASALTGTTSAVNFDYIGTVQASTIEAVNCPFTFNFPANFATPNSYASCGTNPGETDAYTVKVAGSSIGTVSLSTSCVATLTTVGGATKTCTAGQRLEVDAPATVSGADVAITLAFTR